MDAQVGGRALDLVGRNRRARWDAVREWRTGSLIFEHCLADGTRWEEGNDDRPLDGLVGLAEIVLLTHEIMSS